MLFAYLLPFSFELPLLAFLFNKFLFKFLVTAGRHVYWLGVLASQFCGCAATE